MDRFEFFEILIRASFGKYITTKILDDSSDSIKKLIEDKLLMNLPPEARIQPNDFRKNRLYTQEMEGAIKSNWEMLNASFKLYKAKDKTKYFWIEHWIALLEATNLMGSHTGRSVSVSMFNVADAASTLTAAECSAYKHPQMLSA